MSIISDLGLSGGGMLSGSMSVINSILKGLLNIIVILIVATPIMYLLYYIYRILLFRDRVFIFGLVGNQSNYQIDWGRTVNKKDGTTTYKLKSGKRKRWVVPIPEREDYIPADLRGSPALFLCKVGSGDNDLKWLKPNELFNGTKINTISANDRKEFVMGHTNIERAYLKQSWMQKYGGVIVPIAFGVLLVGGIVFAMIYISEMWQSTVQQASALGSDMKEASQIYAENIQRAIQNAKG